MRIEIWSDVVCPWCYIGKRRFEDALDTLAHEGDDITVDVSYRPFQLDPNAPVGTAMSVPQMYAKKFGSDQKAQHVIDKVTTAAAGDGIEFHLDRAVRANTLLAHRLLWWAEQPGVDVDQSTLDERLLAAYFTDGQNVADPDVLADIVAELGVPRDDVVEFLEGTDGVDEVNEYLRYAAENGITAVPTFIVEGVWAIPGAQDPDVFVKVLRKLAAKASVA